MQTQLKCPDGSRPRILFAEDSDTVRLITAALLRRMGCDVDAVEHGEEALDLASRQAYDLVLLDIEMPVMDGMIAAREIRALGGGAARTPLMALSAYLADWHALLAGWGCTPRRAAASCNWRSKRSCDKAERAPQTQRSH